MINTDGNTAALNRHQREQDQLAAQDQQLEEATEKLADDLFNAYFDDNEDVITEIDFILADRDFFKAMRDNFTQDGCALRTAFRRQVALACESMASGRDMDSIERMYREYKL
jgi:hypothetical protein